MCVVEDSVCGEKVKVQGLTELLAPFVVLASCSVGWEWAVYWCGGKSAELVVGYRERKKNMNMSLFRAKGRIGKCGVPDLCWNKTNLEPDCSLLRGRPFVSLNDLRHLRQPFQVFSGAVQSASDKSQLDSYKWPSQASDIIITHSHGAISVCQVSLKVCGTRHTPSSC